MNFEFFLIGCFGAASLEILKAYQLRSKLHHKKYSKLLTSPLFWLATFGMILVSGMVTMIFFEETSNITKWKLMVMGMGTRSLIRDALTTMNSKENISMGSAAEEKINFKDVFQ